MKEELFERCDEFLQYHAFLKETFGLHGSHEEFPVGAYIFLSAGTDPDPRRIRWCRELIQRRHGVFSSFRGYGEDILSCLLAVDPDPEYRLELAILAHRYLASVLSDSYYLPVLAYFFSEILPEAQFAAYARETGRIHKAMNREHSFLTGSEDAIFAGLFALSGRDTDELLDESEAIFRYLKPDFTLNGNTLQTLSHAMTLCPGTYREKCSRVLALLSRLKSEGIRYQKDFSVAALGILANSGMDLNEITADFLYAREYLGEMISSIFVSKERMNYYAVIILASYYMVTSTEFTAALILRMVLLMSTENS